MARFMFGPEEGAFEATGAGFDPDDVVWVRGVDYLGGWREARDAAAELETALRSAGVDTEDMRMTAQTQADGSGMVRLVWTTGVARAVARLLRNAG
ncbi:hypothetical protein ACIHFE_16030 [Streptomyces sp. NPDC052396]|uniref:hypothetical protein n=1 Tax=Streptomyces sp. NPDC052396 TaxID=3365689 RepID=UPI0037D845B1